MIRVVGKRDGNNVSFFFCHLYYYNVVEENLCKKRMGGVCCRFSRNLFPYDLVTWIMLDLDVFMNVRFVILILLFFFLFFDFGLWMEKRIICKYCKISMTSFFIDCYIDRKLKGVKKKCTNWVREKCVKHRNEIMLNKKIVGCPLPMKYIYFTGLIRSKVLQEQISVLN